MEHYLQIYTGNGKGKSTASFGLGVRCLGAGNSLFIGQFLKKGSYSEVDFFNSVRSTLKVNQYLDMEQFGSGDFIIHGPTDSDIALAKKGYDCCYNAINSNKYDMVILDEMITMINLNLISMEDMNILIDLAKTKCELILTGRDASCGLVERADLVTSMSEIKHYFSVGVDGRKGIEF